MAYEDQEEHLMTFDDIAPELSADMRSKRGDDLPEELRSVEEVELDLDAEPAADQADSADDTTKKTDDSTVKQPDDSQDGDAAANADGDTGTDGDTADKAGDHDGKVDNVPYEVMREKVREKNEWKQRAEKAEQDAQALRDQLAAKAEPAATDTSGQDGQGDGQADLPTFDLIGKLKERNAAVYDGDLELADQIDLEIEAHRQLVATTAAEKSAMKSALAALEQREQEARAKADEATRERVKQDILDTSNKVWSRREKAFVTNEELMTRFDEMSSFLAREKGYDPVKAILRAEELLFGAAPEDSADTDTTPAHTDRQRQAIERNVDAAKRQPQSLTGSGAGSRNDRRTPRTALEMDDKEYESLPDKQKKANRGDVIE